MKAVEHYFESRGTPFGELRNAILRAAERYFERCGTLLELRNAILSAAELYFESCGTLAVCGGGVSVASLSEFFCCFLSRLETRRCKSYRLAVGSLLLFPPKRLAEHVKNFARFAGAREKFKRKFSRKDSEIVKSSAPGFSPKNKVRRAANLRNSTAVFRACQMIFGGLANPEV